MIKSSIHTSKEEILRSLMKLYEKDIHAEIERKQLRRLKPILRAFITQIESLQEEIRSWPYILCLSSPERQEFLTKMMWDSISSKYSDILGNLDELLNNPKFSIQRDVKELIKKTLLRRIEVGDTPKNFEEIALKINDISQNLLSIKTLLQYYSTL